MLFLYFFFLLYFPPLVDSGYSSVTQRIYTNFSYYIHPPLFLPAAFPGTMQGD